MRTPDRPQPGTAGLEADTTQPALSVVDAEKSFGSTAAVARVSLELADKELVALVGPSGCGKSTLLRLVAGLHSLDAGSISIAGRQVDDGRQHLPPERRSVGLVFQEHALFPHLTVAKNVAFGVRQEEQKPRVMELLELVGLAGHVDRYPHELSGGERQRVALARALAPRPALLLLDEPFASLDPNLRAQIRADVVSILRSEQIPAVFVTHDQSEAMAVGDRIAVMRAGQIEQLASPEQVFHQPDNVFVGAFMGEAAFLSITDAVHELGATAAIGTDAPIGSVAMVRPDDVTFTLAPNGSAAVTHAEFRGSMWCYTIRLASGAVVQSTRTHLLRVEVGTRVTATFLDGHEPVVIAAR